MRSRAAARWFAGACWAFDGREAYAGRRSPHRRLDSKNLKLRALTSPRSERATGARRSPCLRSPPPGDTSDALMWRARQPGAARLLGASEHALRADERADRGKARV